MTGSKHESAYCLLSRWLAAIFFTAHAATLLASPIYDLSGRVIGSYDSDTASFSTNFLWEARLADADLSSLNGAGVELVSALLEPAKLTGAQISYADFFLADMRAADLSKSTAEFSDFSLADLDSARFNTANLSDALFYRADLTSSNFEAAKLNRADFRGANLSGANFYLADLSGVRFGLAARSNKERSSSVASTDFRASNLTDTQGLTTTSGAAFYDSNTVLAANDPVALGWVNMPRSTLQFGGQYIQTIAFSSAVATTNASLAEAIISTPNNSDWQGGSSSNLLQELASYKVGGVGENEPLSMVVTLDPSLQGKDVRLWHYSGAGWQELPAVMENGNQLAYSISDGGGIDNAPEQGVIKQSLAVSMTSAPALPVPTFGNLHLLTLSVLIMLLGWLSVTSVARNRRVE